VVYPNDQTEHGYFFIGYLMRPTSTSDGEACLSMQAIQLYSTMQLAGWL